jgi:hypothetical protein
MATRKGLAECAQEIDAAYKGQVEIAIEAVEAVLSAEDSRTKVGDPNKLKVANAALDEATKPLAEIMMDKAMEAMLRKKGLIT